MRNIGHAKTEAALNLITPSGLTYVEGSLLCGRSTCQYADSAIQWVGVIAPRDTIPVRFALQIPDDAICGQQFLSEPMIVDQSRQEQSMVEGSSIVAARNRPFLIVFTEQVDLTVFLPMVVDE